jgi:RimJ/RimL family protein N-acetyltransferase
VPVRQAAEPADPLVPELADELVRLFPVVPDDTEFLYDLTARPENCFRWRYRGLPPSYERFVNDLWQSVMVQFVVRRASDNERIGHVVAYAANPSLQYCHLGALFVPQYKGTGIPAHAVSLFARYLFHTCPFKKLYLEVPGYNWDQVRSGEGRLFTVEGVLREHNWYAGRHWDEYLCAIYRDGPDA